MLTQEEAKRILNLAEEWVLAERKQCYATYERRIAHDKMISNAESLGYFMAIFEMENQRLHEAEQAKATFIKFWNGLFEHVEEGEDKND